MKQVTESEGLAVYDSFLRPDTLLVASEYVTQKCPMFSITQSNWTGSDYWHPNDGNILKSERWDSANTPKPLSSLVEEVNKFFDFNSEYHEMNFSAFAYPAGSMLGMHNDGNAVKAFVIYMCDWHETWGGELIVGHKEGIGTAIYPRKNRLVIISGGVPHKIVPVDFRVGYSVRYSVAGFYKVKEVT